MQSLENPIQRKCDTCESEEKESQPEQEIQTKLTVGAVGDPYEQEAQQGGGTSNVNARSCSSSTTLRRR